MTRTASDKPPWPCDWWQRTRQWLRLCLRHRLRRTGIRLRQAMQRMFGSDDDAQPGHTCTAEALLAFTQASTTQAGWEVDPATWQDLEVPALLARIQALGAGVSPLGQQLLHQRLRTGPLNSLPPLPASAWRLEAAQGTLDAASAPVLHRLRHAQADAVALLFCDTPYQAPAWLRWMGAVPVLVLAGLLALPFTLGALWLLAVALLASAWVQMRLYLPLQRWKRERTALLAMLDAASFWATLREQAGQPAHQHPMLQAWADGTEATRLRQALQPRAHHGLAALNEYLNLFALSEYRELGRQTQALSRERRALQAACLRVGSIEAAIAWARLLRASPTWCEADTSPVRQLAFTALGNPVLAAAEPIPAVAAEGGGLFISGENGVGKSTLLRSLGLNLLCARAFGHCFAQSALVPALPVLSAIQVTDSLAEGRSLYVTELQRARQMLEASTSASGQGAVLLIDEIFRSTNHLESVSAAAAVLAQLAQRSLLLVCSHNLVLAPLLRGALTPVCVLRPGPQRNGLCMQPGVLSQTNGIRLLADMGLPPAVVQDAQTVFNWLAPYLSQPADCPSLAQPCPSTPACPP